jgi:hypothetical protein
MYLGRYFPCNYYNRHLLKTLEVVTSQLRGVERIFPAAGIAKIRVTTKPSAISW